MCSSGFWRWWRNERNNNWNFHFEPLMRIWGFGDFDEDSKALVYRLSTSWMELLMILWDIHLITYFWSLFHVRLTIFFGLNVLDHFFFIYAKWLYFRLVGVSRGCKRAEPSKDAFEFDLILGKQVWAYLNAWRALM